jgi:hypothetical protein
MTREGYPERDSETFSGTILGDAERRSNSAVRAPRASSEFAVKRVKEWSKKDAEARRVPFS